MSNLSSINFKKSFTINTEHNDRTLPPSYLIDKEKGVEYNRTSKSARELKNKIIKEAIDTYTKRTKQKFQAKSYEWSAVVNIKPTTTMQDLENLANHFNEKYGFQCYQIAIHRDEGHIDEQGEKQINHHAHLEFITLDKNSGLNCFKMRDFNKQAMREIQTQTAQILKMERGIDKRISKRERVEPRKYGQIKEQEKQNLKTITQELFDTKQALETLRKESKNQGFTAEYFQELNKAKKELSFKNQEAFNKWKNELIQRHTKKSFFSTKTDTNSIIKEQFLKIQELNDIIQANEKSKISDLEAEKEKVRGEVTLTLENQNKTLLIALQNDLKEQATADLEKHKKEIHNNLIKQLQERENLLVKKEKELEKEKETLLSNNLILSVKQAEYQEKVEIYQQKIKELDLNTRIQQLKQTHKDELQKEQEKNQLLAQEVKDLQNQAESDRVWIEFLTETKNRLQRELDKYIAIIKKACEMPFNCFLEKTPYKQLSVTFKNFFEANTQTQDELKEKAIKCQELEKEKTAQKTMQQKTQKSQQQNFYRHRQR